MNTYDQMRAIAHDILYSGLLSSCSLMQTNQHRGGALNLMHADLRKKYDALIWSEGVPNKGELGMAPSRLEHFVAVVEAVREIERFGVFKDIRNPPYRLIDSPESREQHKKFFQLEERIQVALRSADEFAAVEGVANHVNAPLPAMKNLDDLLSDREYSLVVEGLYALRERKENALSVAQSEPAFASLRADDFGIPQIDALLARFASAPEASEEHNEGSDVEYAEDEPQGLRP